MKLLKCFMGDCQGGFNYIRRLFANLEKKLHFVYRNTFIMKRSTYTISLNAGKKFKITYIYFQNMLPILPTKKSYIFDLSLMKYYFVQECTIFYYIC